MHFIESVQGHGIPLRNTSIFIDGYEGAEWRILISFVRLDLACKNLFIIDVQELIKTMVRTHPNIFVSRKRMSKLVNSSFAVKTYF